MEPPINYTPYIINGFMGGVKLLLVVAPVFLGWHVFVKFAFSKSDPIPVEVVNTDPPD